MFGRIAALTLVLALAGALVACGDGDDNGGAGLQIEEIVIGDGAEAQASDTVTVNYSGRLEDGTEFDSGTLTRPLGDLIPGWQQGVPGMNVGGKRRLVIPPELAYGEEGFGAVIPPNATLTFEIELVSIP